MSFDAVTAVLVIPAGAAALLVLLPDYRLTARLNIVASLTTFLAALSLFVTRPEAGRYLLVDDLNNTFIVLTTSRQDSDIGAAYRLGVNSYIVKPVDFVAFSDVAKRIEMYWVLTNVSPFKDP